MPLRASNDFGARYFDPTNKVLSIHDHFFPGANTGVAHLLGHEASVKRHQEFLEGCLRVDLFGVKDGGGIDARLQAPIRPTIPVLRKGRTYLLEAVVRTLTLGHPFTQGTVDSNEIWVDTKVTSGDRVVGRSGGLGPYGEVDPWAHFLNVYLLDREGRRIDRRNAQDIFTPLYNHQIPPGAAAVVHYAFTVPEALVDETLVVEVKVQYRKFDTIYVNYIKGDGYTNGAPFQVTNDLPITTLASDRVTFLVQGKQASTEAGAQSPLEAGSSTLSVPEWQRWNDYGIGLFLASTGHGSEKGALIQAAEAFAQVEKLGRPEGPLNLARVYEKEGRLTEAVQALQRAAAHDDPPAPRWTVAWFNGRVNKQNGYLDRAITEFRSIVEDRYPELEQRGFDFSKDYVVLNELGQTLFERAKLERGDARSEAREAFLRDAIQQFEKTLQLDAENVTAHYNLALIYESLGESDLATEHRQLHERYRPDDNARDRAVTMARRASAAADHAAQAIVIYSLQRPGAPELPAQAAASGDPGTVKSASID
jgi:tetratricopeptide (TPR) repeat protein